MTHSNVFRQNKMPGRAQQMRAQNPAIRERLFNIGVGSAGAKAERPFRPGEVLGLHGHQRANDVLDRGRRSAIQVQGAQALEGDACCRSQKSKCI